MTVDTTLQDWLLQACNRALPQGVDIQWVSSWLATKSEADYRWLLSLPLRGEWLQEAARLRLISDDPPPVPATDGSEQQADGLYWQAVDKLCGQSNVPAILRLLTGAVQRSDPGKLRLVRRLLDRMGEGPHLQPLLMDANLTVDEVTSLLGAYAGHLIQGLGGDMRLTAAIGRYLGALDARTLASLDTAVVLTSLDVLAERLPAGDLPQGIRDWKLICDAVLRPESAQPSLSKLIKAVKHVPGPPDRKASIARAVMPALAQRIDDYGALDYAEEQLGPDLPGQILALRLKAYERSQDLGSLEPFIRLGLQGRLAVEDWKRLETLVRKSGNANLRELDGRAAGWPPGQRAKWRIWRGGADGGAGPGGPAPPGWGGPASGKGKRATGWVRRLFRTRFHGLVLILILLLGLLGFVVLARPGDGQAGARPAQTAAPAEGVAVPAEGVAVPATAAGQPASTPGASTVTPAALGTIGTEGPASAVGGVPPTGPPQRVNVPPPGYYEYIVKENDSPIGIANALLGAEKRWHDIRRADGEPLRAETLHPGDKLWIPKN